MKLVLIRKTGPSPVVLMYEAENDDGDVCKVTKELAVGSSIEVDDDVGYALLAQYKGILKIEGQPDPVVKVAGKPAVKGKALKASPSNKALDESPEQK
jgi:hypothetical protein